MREKTASALDFLSVPHKTSAMTYEVMAKQASDEYMKSGMPPNEFIAKLASDRGLNSEQVHRVCELANHQINATMSKEASDQLFTFPVATVEGVFSAMNKGSQLKAASVSYVELDGGVYGQLDKLPDYVQLVATRRFNQKLASEKTAAAPVAEVSYRMRLHEIEQQHKVASAEFEYQQLALREHLGRMRVLFGKMASSESKEDFLLAAGVVLGQAAAEKLAEEFGLGKVTIEGIDKVASHLDHEHDLVKELDSFKRTIDNYIAAKTEAEKTASVMRDIADKARMAASKIKRGVLGAGQVAVELGRQAHAYVKPGIEAFKSHKPGEAIERAVTQEGSVGRRLATIAAGAALADAAGFSASTGANIAKNIVVGSTPIVKGLPFNVRGVSKLSRAIPVMKKSVQEAT